MRENEDEDEVV